MRTIAKPFGLLLMFLYGLVGNYGIAILLFAIVVKVILLPFQMKAKRGQMQQQRIQPRVKELQKKHAANKQVMNQEVQKLYREEGVSMTGGCLWTILPLPITLALYYAIREPLTTMMNVASNLFSEGGAILEKLRVVLGNPDYLISSGFGEIGAVRTIASHWDQFKEFASAGLKQLNFSFFGLDLGIQPTYKVWELSKYSAEQGITVGASIILLLIPLISAGLTLAMSLISQRQNKQFQTPDPDNPNPMANSKMMFLLGPVMSLLFGFSMPAAISLYWGFGYILDIIRDSVLFKVYTKRLDEEDRIKNEARLLKEAELERKRIETERLRAENATEVNRNTSKDKRKAAERQEKERKRLEYEREHGIAPEPEQEAGREGQRRFARGRAYVQDRYVTDGILIEDSAISYSDNIEITQTDQPAEGEDTVS